MNDVEVAIAVVCDGAAVVRRRFASSLERIEKGGGDFATDADVEAEEAMLATLRRERPGDAVVGEELGRSGADGRGRTWLLDPLCGTLNFAVRMRVVAVNAALVTASGTAVAAVAEPFADRVFWTDGRSATAREGSEEATLLEPSASSGLVDLNLDPPFPNASWFRAATLAANDGFTAGFRARVVSSSLALTWVASGQRAAYITDGDVRGSVHFTAGLAVCERAGCRISDLRGERWDAGAGGLIVAADDATHRALVHLVGRSG
jgi:myo-inositol-1(or 4)-monophosphatase